MVKMDVLEVVPVLVLLCVVCGVFLVGKPWKRSIDTAAHVCIKKGEMG